MKRTTPNNITSLKQNEIFVFGSNLSGIHGGGAARTALQWGARMGQPIGIQGQTYAIPTKDAQIANTLSLEEIKVHVGDFIEWAKYHNGNIFLVTEIGCGLAGLTPSQVAPLFKECAEISNVYLPHKFWQEIIF